MLIFFFFFDRRFQSLFFDPVFQASRGVEIFVSRARARCARPGPHLSSSWGPPAESKNSVVVQLRSSALH